MATQNYTWPSVSVSATNPSVGTNGSTAPTSSTEIGGVGPDGNLHPISTDNSGTVNANVTSSVLPTGAATAAKQDTGNTSLASIDSKVSTSALQTTGNTSLASIDSKTPALGQALAAASVPVVLTAAQLSTLTPLTSVTVTQATGTNLHVVVDSSALPTGAATESSLGFIVTSSQQTANNTAALNLSAGASTTSKTGPVILGSVTTAAPSYSTGQVNFLSLTTGGALRVDASAATVTVAQATGTNLHTVVDSSALPTGAATSALQTTGNTSLASIDTSTAFLATTQGASTSGQRGPVVFGAATTNSPSLTTGNSYPISLNTRNAVRVDASQPPVAGTITQAAKTIGTTAARLTVSGSAPSANRTNLVVTPDSASTAKFYIGSSSVTSTGATRGIQIVAGQSFIANSDAGDYYIVSDTASQTVYVMEQA